MIKLKLKIATQEYVEYYYIPEDKGTPGEIRTIISNNDTSIIRHTETDNFAGRYAFKASKAIEGCVERKIFPLEFIQAWN